MRDFFSQKITYEEISAITQKIYSSIGGFYLKSTKTILPKNRNFSQDYSRPCAKNWTSTKFNFLSNKEYSFCESFQTLLAF